MSDVLQLDDVTFAYPGRPPLLEHASLTLKRGGHVACVLGPSGIGKSTLVRLVMGQLTPDAGTIRVVPSVLPVFQEYERMLLPWFSARRNLTFGLREPEQEDLLAVTDLLEITDLLPSLPGKTSGGQRQRIVLARALLRRPELLVLDEPLASVDSRTLGRVLPRLKKFLQEAGISVLWVTHNITEAAKMATSVRVLNEERRFAEFIVSADEDEKSLVARIYHMVNEQVRT